MYILVYICTLCSAQERTSENGDFLTDFWSQNLTVFRFRTTQTLLLKLVFPTQVDFTSKSLRAINATELRAIPSNFLAFVFKLFDNIQCIPLIIVQFLSTTKNSIKTLVVAFTKLNCTNILVSNLILSLIFFIIFICSMITKKLWHRKTTF